MYKQHTHTNTRGTYTVEDEAFALDVCSHSQAGSFENYSQTHLRTFRKTVCVHKHAHTSFIRSCMRVRLIQVDIFAHRRACSNALIISPFNSSTASLNSSIKQEGKKYLYININISTVLLMHPFELPILFKCNSIPHQNEQLLHGCVEAFSFRAHFKAICLLCRLLTLSVVIKGAHRNLWFNYTGLVMQRGPGWGDMLNKNK